VVCGVDQRPRLGLGDPHGDCASVRVQYSRLQHFTTPGVGLGGRARVRKVRCATKRANEQTSNAQRAARRRQPTSAPAMPAAKIEDLRWLMVVYKRVVEEAPQKAIAAHCHRMLGFESMIGGRNRFLYFLGRAICLK